MSGDTRTFRAAVAAELEAWRQASAPATDIVYENGPVKGEDEISSPWVDTEVRFYGARPATAGVRPLGRHSGAIAVAVYTRQGEGTGDADALVDSLIERFRTRYLGGGNLSFPQRLTPTTLKGWHKVGILIPFTLDTN